MAQQLAEPAVSAAAGKAPRTARGEKTMRKILDAALAEFGEKGFSDSSIVSITSRAKVALGTFYTYFDSKEALFAALVQDMSRRVRDHVAPAIAGTQDMLDAEAPGAWRPTSTSSSTTNRSTGSSTRPSSSTRRASAPIMRRRRPHRGEASSRRRAGQLRPCDPLDNEVRAWALMGMNVFLGLRFGVWGEEDAERVAAVAKRHAGQGPAPLGQPVCQDGKGVDVGLIVIEREANAQDIAANVSDAVLGHQLRIPARSLG